MSIAVVGMLDEREEALGVIKDGIEQRGHKALLIDISIGTGAIVPSLKPDVSCGELAALGGGPPGGVSEMLMGRRDKAISIIPGEGGFDGEERSPMRASGAKPKFSGNNWFADEG